jgi:O-methyltransferase involved in polyketide biosynthesis
MMTGTPADDMLPRFDVSSPSIARVYDYVLGGKDNFPADRAEGDRLMQLHPPLRRLARRNRKFLAEAVHYLADAGIRQFIDLGSGLPTAQNTHQVAQAVAPDAGVVYVDNDPMAASHAAALLADGRGVIAVRADLADPAPILDIPAVRDLIRPDEPTAVVLAMVLHFFEAAAASRIVAGWARAVAPGSALVVSCGSGDDESAGAITREYRAADLHNHSRTQITAWLDGLEIMDPPGLVDANSWLPGRPARPPSERGAHILAAIARKPVKPSS